MESIIRIIETTLRAAGFPKSQYSVTPSVDETEILVRVHRPGGVVRSFIVKGANLDIDSLPDYVCHGALNES